MQLLFSADRAFHLEKEIIPLLKQGVSVVCDRYSFSTLAFGSVGNNDFDWFVSLQKKFLMPDIVFFLKVAPTECIKRISKSRFETTLFEKKEVFEKVWQNYEKIAKIFENIYIINGERPINEIAKEIQQIIQNKLLK